MKSELQERLGRFVLVINEMEKVVYIRPVDGRAPSKKERLNIEKFLRYKRPDIVHPTVQTGWGIQSSLDLPM
ncbi:MAG: hypothetical protein GTO41_01505 [Burkholderiales bacterium]|nr:hypothetical protein [Burkholderiales bacterium]